MSPLTVIVSSQAGHEMKVMVRVTRPKSILNTRDILITDTTYCDKSKDGVDIAKYRCTKLFNGYKLIRLTCGDYYNVREGVQTLLDCQKLALIDYCEKEKCTLVQQIVI